MTEYGVRHEYYVDGLHHRLVDSHLRVGRWARWNRMATFVDAHGRIYACVTEWYNQSDLAGVGWLGDERDELLKPDVVYRLELQPVPIQDSTRA